jgi:hypothetical protein
MADHGEHQGYADALLFATFLNSVAPVNVRYCALCGVLVADENLHDIFHAQLERR